MSTGAVQGSPSPGRFTPGAPHRVGAVPTQALRLQQGLWHTGQACRGCTERCCSGTEEPFAAEGFAD